MLDRILKEYKECEVQAENCLKEGDKVLYMFWSGQKAGLLTSYLFIQEEGK